jgi:hypothetical protein
MIAISPSSKCTAFDVLLLNGRHQSDEVLSFASSILRGYLIVPLLFRLDSFYQNLNYAIPLLSLMQLHGFQFYSMLEHPQ